MFCGYIYTYLKLIYTISFLKKLHQIKTVLINLHEYDYYKINSKASMGTILILFWEETS